jgi:tRNA U38,U39,U40 pseudouridine synthase TruA
MNLLWGLQPGSVYLGRYQIGLQNFQGSNDFITFVLEQNMFQIPVNKNLKRIRSLQRWRKRTKNMMVFNVYANLFMQDSVKTN